MAAGEEPQPERQKLGPWRVFKAVLWSFFGVRRSRDYEEDITHLTLLQVVFAGVIGGVLFVLTVLLVVNLVVP